MLKKDFEALTDLLNRLTALAKGGKPDDRRFESASDIIWDVSNALDKLCKDIEELNYFTSNLSQGNLNIEPPPRNNYLAGHIKGMQSKLKHLTWQASQVEQGDYSQSVDYMGEFSRSFNHMIHTLKEREEGLKNEILLKEQARQAVNESNALLETILYNITDVVIAVQNQGIVFSNAAAGKLFSSGSVDADVLLSHILNHINTDNEKVTFEVYDDIRKKWFSVKSIPIQYKDLEGTHLFIAADITDIKVKERKLTDMANIDELTGIPNRRGGLANLRACLKNEKNYPFCLCYIDLDGLKEMNDHYGHAQGDLYIQKTVQAIQSNTRKSDFIARIGGDEFFVIFLHLTKENCRQILERALLQLQVNKEELDIETKMSFSYGIMEITKPGSLSAEDYLKQADLEMYELKQRKKGQA